MGIRFLTTLAALGFAAMAGISGIVPAMATVMRIDSIQSAVTGGFGHSEFHSASSNGGKSGAITDRITGIDAGGINLYDTATGQLDATLTLDTGGTATVSGILDFGVTAEAVLGTLHVSFSGTASNRSGKLFDIVYLNHNYGIGSGDIRPNGFVNNIITLWGAAGTPLGGLTNPNGSGSFDTQTTTLGSDIVFNLTDIPEPAPLSLFLLGLAGLIAGRRRQAARA